MAPSSTSSMEKNKVSTCELLVLREIGVRAQKKHVIPTAQAQDQC